MGGVAIVTSDIRNRKNDCGCAGMIKGPSDRGQPEGPGVGPGCGKRAKKNLGAEWSGGKGS